MHAHNWEEKINNLDLLQWGKMPTQQEAKKTNKPHNDDCRDVHHETELGYKNNADNEK